MEGELRELLNVRIQDLPTAIQDELKLVLEENPMYETLGEIQGRIDRLETRKQAILGGLMEVYSQANDLNSLVSMLEEEDSHKAWAALFEFYENQGEMVNALAALDEIEDNSQGMEDWKSLALLEYTLKEEDRDWGELTQTEEDQVRNIAAEGPSDNEGFFKAISILSLAYGEEYPVMVPLLILNDDFRQVYVEKPLIQAVVYPNPCKNYFIVETVVGQEKIGELFMFDVSGKVAYSLTFQPSSVPILVELNELPAGTYQIKLYLSGNPVLQQTLVVQ